MLAEPRGKGRSRSRLTTQTPKHQTPTHNPARLHPRRGRHDAARGLAAGPESVRRGDPADAVGGLHALVPRADGALLRPDGCVPFTLPCVIIDVTASSTYTYTYTTPGSLTYIGTMIASRSTSSAREGRQLVATLLVMTWALRLGMFLFDRVIRVGKDSRFDKVKDKPLLFLQCVRTCVVCVVRLCWGRSVAWAETLDTPPHHKLDFGPCRGSGSSSAPSPSSSSTPKRRARSGAPGRPPPIWQACCSTWWGSRSR